MGTRLLAEKLIKAEFPAIKYLRVHTTGKGIATIYAWDENFKIDDVNMRKLSEFGTNEILAHVYFNVKPYDQLMVDAIPDYQEPSEIIVEAALTGGLNKEGIIRTINKIFPDIDLVYNGYDSGSGNVNFYVSDSDRITQIEREIIEQYVSEIIPLGGTVQI
ncbi:hypothetical protein NV379_02300 [Paenibacillus sp. N1-5-1-14]|uniref:hypothetical protein n=1 Tax=Paenibacillus radicibacter TaxID=2972488 RepID=UPI0021596A69|nr:hypothetical protein [Paenibacillus radicibacter]MCR8641478.1 hypothetical protein [Paenibacillus radicibacter]